MFLLRLLKVCDRDDIKLCVADAGLKKIEKNSNLRLQK